MAAGPEQSKSTDKPTGRAPPRRLRRVAMQVDDEVVQHFKKLAAEGGNGERYTALINEALLEYVRSLKQGRRDAPAGALARQIRLELERLFSNNS